MGTWATDAFGNDSACDWAHDLDESDDLTLVERAIATVLEKQAGYLDADDATDALAAIEVIARLRGHWGFRNSYTEAVDDWVLRTRLSLSKELITNAIAALDRIVSKDSELKELWEEADGAEWLASIAELKNRVLAEPQPIIDSPAATQDALQGQPGVINKDIANKDIEKMLKRINAINFSKRVVAGDSSVAELYNAILVSGALCDVESTRDLVARMWQPLVMMEKESILWDLAVREAQTFALQGYLEEALAGLEAWRTSAIGSVPAQFDMRAYGVCLSAHDLDRARAYNDKVCAADKENSMWRIDRALLEARLGSAEHARAILAAERIDSLPPTSKLCVTLIKGILACRSGDPAARELLTEATQGFIEMAGTSAAAWPLFAICCGWYALALGHAGQGNDAQALLQSIALLFMQPNNRQLIAALKEAGVLSSDTPLPSFPIVTSTPSIKPPTSTDMTDHGVFKTIRARGVNAMQVVERYRREFAAGSGRYPFLIGDESELNQLLEVLEVPSDGGVAALEQAKQFDVTAWLKEHSPTSKVNWPKQKVTPSNLLLTQYDALTKKLKAEMVIGLIELDHPSELFARLGYGNWNDCPAPPVHVALHAYWQDHYGAEPIAVSSDVVECIVTKPPAEKKAALELAKEHHGYCYDIVEQGVGTTGNLAATLLNARYWYFWWD